MNKLEHLALAGVRGLTSYQAGKPAEELERELGLSEIIKLASNENPLGAGKLARIVLRKGCNELSRYPDGSGYDLKNKLASRLNVEADQIVLGNGSNELLELVARVFVSAENEVIFSEHSFAVYSLVTQAIGAKAVVVPASDWGNDLSAMLTAITDATRLIFIANPNNPTGTWIAGDELEAFVRQVPDHVIVVIDEAYFEYVQEPDYPNAVNWLPSCPNLLVTRTFSKIHGLAALRLGYGIASSDMSELLNRVRQPFNVNTLASVAGLAAIDDHEHIQNSIKTNHQGLRQIEQACNSLGLAYIPSVGNFLCIDFSKPAMPIYDALLREGVIVRPVANDKMPDFLRVTVGTCTENARFIDALCKVLA